jgi:hypothetical protein
MVSEYTPPLVKSAGEITGFWTPELKEPGPAQEYVAKGTTAVLNVIVPPSHTGLFEVIKGVGGGLGSDSVTGPAGRELQPPSVIIILEYVPAESPPIVRLPAALEVWLTGAC